MWAKDVIRDEERARKRLSSTSVRAYQEIQDTQHVLDAHDDSVHQIQETLQSINTTCERRLLELEQERIKKEDEARRLEAIKLKRAAIGNKNRSLAFGKITNKLDGKGSNRSPVASPSPAPKPVPKPAPLLDPEEAKKRSKLRSAAKENADKLAMRVKLLHAIELDDDDY